MHICPVLLLCVHSPPSCLCRICVCVGTSHGSLSALHRADMPGDSCIPAFCFPKHKKTPLGKLKPLCPELPLLSEKAGPSRLCWKKAPVRLSFAVLSSFCTFGQAVNHLYDFYRISGNSAFGSLPHGIPLLMFKLCLLDIKHYAGV